MPISAEIRERLRYNRLDHVAIDALEILSAIPVSWHGGFRARYQAKLQEVFSKIVRLQRQQGCAAITEDEEEGDACVLRDDKGGKCAVGCLIPDENYRAEMEELSVSDCLRAKWALDAIPELCRPATETVAGTTWNEALLHTLEQRWTQFLVVMQRVHDVAMFDPTKTEARWEALWRDIATVLELEVPDDDSCLPRTAP